MIGSAFCDGPKGCACSAGYTENNGGCISQDDGGIIKNPTAHCFTKMLMTLLHVS